MSSQSSTSVDATETGDRRRPLWLATLAGWAVPLTIAWVVLIVLVERDNARLDEGHMFEADGAVRPPALWTLQWLLAMAGACLRMAAGAAVAAAGQMLIVHWPERREPQPKSVWVAAGAAGTLPIACLWWAQLLLDPRPAEFAAPLYAYLLPAALLALLGALAGRIGWQVRHREGTP